jgi:hypothetical protein
MNKVGDICPSIGKIICSFIYYSPAYNASYISHCTRQSEGKKRVGFYDEQYLQNEEKRLMNKLSYNTLLTENK